MLPACADSIFIKRLLRNELFVDLDNNAGAYGSAAFTDSETKVLLDSDGGDKLNVHINVVAGHAHFSAFGKSDNTGNVGSSEIELRTSC